MKEKSPTDIKEFFVTKEEENIRIDKLLSTRFSMHSRTYFQYLIENGHVLYNNKKIKKRICPKEGANIQISFIPPEEISLEPEDIPLDILFEDDHIIAINKPSSMVVHPAPGNPCSTFANALIYHCKELDRDKKDIRPGIVHRLDKDTSGVLIAAKTYEAHQKLIVAFQNREINKEYLAICIGCPKEQTINAPIGRHPIRRKEMTVIHTGKEAITDIKVLAKTEMYSLLSIKIHTGRTHQIRVHLKHINTPILGDQVYGNSKKNLSLHVDRQLLHAHCITFFHPITKASIKIQAPLPNDMNKWVKVFSKY